MRAHATCTGHLHVTLPPEEAFPLFTPEGERGWVAEWDPRYPIGGRPDPAPGIVFLTAKAEGDALWLVTRYEPHRHRAAYVCVVAGHRAVLVEVAVQPGEHGGSRVDVRYDMTSLSPEADHFVRDFEGAYGDFLAAWSAALTKVGG
jgi:hypothetical protein